MGATPRPYRLFWILAGVVLLIGTVVGAGWVLNGNGNHGEPNKSAPYTEDVAFVGIGFVEPKGGVAALYPTQTGRVVWVEAEGTAVKKGDPLLKLEKSAADFQLRQAKAALDAARATLAKAKSGLEQHQLKVKQQEAAVDVAKARKAEAEENLKRADDLAKIAKAAAAIEKRIIELKVKEAVAGITVEESKLLELKTYDPQNDVNLAQADLNAKEALVDTAEFALKEHTLAAPSDGMVLRVWVNPGELLGPNPKTPAIQFSPKGAQIVRAEVLQEWADRVKENQEVVIEDDTRVGARWKGKVHYVGKWIAPRRHIIIEPFQLNDVRTLEAVVEISPESERPLLIGQRVRVTFKKVSS